MRRDHHKNQNLIFDLLIFSQLLCCFSQSETTVLCRGQSMKLKKIGVKTRRPHIYSLLLYYEGGQDFNGVA